MRLYHKSVVNRIYLPQDMEERMLIVSKDCVKGEKAVYSTMQKKNLKC